MTEYINENSVGGEPDDPIIGTGRGAFRGSEIVPKAQQLEALATSLAQTAKQVQWKTPQQYGAKGDGVTDDSASFKTMLTTDLEKNIRIPAGTYLINTSEKLPLQDMVGEGKPMIKFTHKDGGFIKYKNGDRTTYGGFGRLKNLYLHGNQTCDYLITCGFCSEGTLEDVNFGQAEKAAIKVNYLLEIVDIISVTVSDIPNFIEVDAAANEFNALNSINIIGGNYWSIDNLINTFKEGNARITNAWFEKTDRILLKQNNSGGFSITMTNNQIIKSRGTNPLFTLNNTGTDKIYFHSNRVVVNTVAINSLFDFNNGELTNSLASEKLIYLHGNDIGGYNLSLLVSCNSGITNKNLGRVRVLNNLIDYNFSWYLDIKLGITSGLSIRGMGSPIYGSNFLDFSLHPSDGESKILYDTTNKYLYLTDVNQINKFPIQIARSYDTASRPTGGKLTKGLMVFDNNLGKPIWWNGTAWIDSTGTTV